MSRSSVATIIATAILAVSTAGCASTKKKFEQGVKAEESGRYEEASELYIEVLRNEPDWQDARSRLEYTGRITIENRLVQASELESEGAFVRSSDMLGWVAAFRSRANAVGARLELPSGFDGRRERLEDLAVRQLLNDADRARAEDRWADALRLYDQALRRGRLDRKASESVHESRAAILVEWADESLAATRYRTAFEKARQALDIVGMEHALTPRILSIQDSALQEGSVRVAVLPVTATEKVRRDASSLLLTDINDLLVYEHWSHAPPFILVADPVAVRRELRSEVGRSGRVVSRNESISVSRRVAAEWVVVPEVVALDHSERSVRRKEVRARTRGRGAVDTTYVLHTVEVKYRSRSTVRIYDVRSGRRLYEGDVDAAVDDRYDRGEYSGDYRHLDLSGSELSYFDPEELHTHLDRIEEALADELARKIAQRVYSQTTSWIQ